MTKILKIGLVAGVNPIVAPFVKAAIFRAAAESARTVELVEDELELRKDAPTERIALGDSKITALESAWRLQEKGCDVALIANLRSEAYIDEVRTELQMPIVSLYAGMPEAVKAKGARKIGSSAARSTSPSSASCSPNAKSSKVRASPAPTRPILKSSGKKQSSFSPPAPSFCSPSAVASPAPPSSSSPKACPFSTS